MGSLSRTAVDEEEIRLRAEDDERDEEDVERDDEDELDVDQDDADYDPDEDPDTGPPASGGRTMSEGRRPSGDAPVRVTPYRDGPYLLRGPVELVDQDGNVIETGGRTIALCRCGRSQTRPFCDGTHKVVGFAAPSGVERAG